MSKSPKSKKRPTGDYAVGYARPPVKSRAKAGQVLNPHGRNGKPKPKIDPYEEAMSKTTVVVMDGKRMTLTAEQVMYLTQSAKASKGDTHAFNALARERHRRLGSGPPTPTAEEIIAEERRLEQAKANAVRMFGAMKKLRMRSAEATELGLVIIDENGNASVPDWARAAAEAHWAAVEAEGGERPDE